MHYPRARTYSPTVTLNVTKLTGVSPTVTRVTLAGSRVSPPQAVFTCPSAPSRGPCLPPPAPLGSELWISLVEEGLRS